MFHKYLNYALISIIATMMYTIAFADNSPDRRYDDEDFVGEIDCVIYDAQINGFKIDRIDAEGFLTEIRD